MAMHPGTKTAIAVAAGTVGAGWYVRKAQSEGDYISPWTTELAGWGAGACLVWLGYKHNSFLISLMGAGIAALNIAQFAARKQLAQPTVLEALEGKIPVHDKDYADQIAEMGLLKAGEWAA